MPKKPKRKHRGAAAAVNGEPEKLALPVYIRKELAKMKAAGRWDGDPFSPDLDPAVTLSIIMVDERNDAALRAACAKSLIPFIHEDKSLAFKAQASDAGGTVMVVVKSYSQPGLAAPATTYDRDEPVDDASLKDAALTRNRGTQPTPEVPGGATPIDRDRSFRTGLYVMQKREGEDIERPVAVSTIDRVFNGTPPEPVVIRKFDADR